MLRPLMLDVVPSIQQTAALALGRLADHSDELAEAVVREDILPQLVHSLGSQNVSTPHNCECKDRVHLNHMCETLIEDQQHSLHFTTHVFIENILACLLCWLRLY